MTFKKEWETTNTQIQPSKEIIEKMVLLAYPKDKLISSEFINEGCSNLNIKIQLERNQNPYILRVYCRDKTAVYREKKFADLLKNTVPLPKIYLIGKIDGFHFAITEFITGITLRELLLSDITHDMSEIMYNVGEMLSKITQHTFSHPGFFNENLEILPAESRESLQDFTQVCLKNEIILSLLGQSTIEKISEIFNQNPLDLIGENEAHLVHGDFGPENILVAQDADSWKITSILDWEFAFSGTVLWDVANMLRYAHQMPSRFQDAFLKGLETNGVVLPENWENSIQCFNLSALLDCLKRTDPKTEPLRCKDICHLINYIVDTLWS